MKRIILYVFLILNLVALILWSEYYCKEPKILSVTFSDGLTKNDKKEMIVNIEVNNNLKTKCRINNGKWIKAKDKKCVFEVESGKYNIEIENLDNKIIKKQLVDINEIKNISFSEEKIYLALTETYKIKEKIEKVGEPDLSLKWESDNSEIVSVENGIIKGNNVGEVNIKVTTLNNKSSNIKVIVTDIITPRTLNNNKRIVPCNAYTEEENLLLDDILKTRIKNKGEGTRAAAIEALRFLPLSFKYKVPYFFENGRLKPYGKMNYVDGEGRYYNKGLYLSNSKKSNIKSSLAGPSIWGCPLTNYDTSYGWTYKGKYPNGLDCSGFISWALYNAGIDVGDIGSGVTQGQDDISDLGEMHELTYEFANSDKYKVGDIIARDGHTAMIAGKDDENIYIAESLLKGVVIEKFSYKNKNSKLYKLYGYINTLDGLYKSDGDYENMW